MKRVILQLLGVLFVLFMSVGCGDDTNKVIDEILGNPTISLNGSKTVRLKVGEVYIELNAVARDSNGDILPISISGEVNSERIGNYTITYTAIDSEGNEVSETRMVKVEALNNEGNDINDAKPTITLNGNNPETVIKGDSYTDAEATAKDSNGGALSVTSSGEVDTSVAGSYTIVYTAVDTLGNSATASRVVNVIDSSVCEDLGSVTYTTDKTLNAPCYKAYGITIEKNKLLTIKEGTRIIFEDSGYMIIKGALKAVGTQEKPIIFTGATQSSGQWQGIQFENSVDNRNELAYIVIEYAGSWNYGALYTNGSTKLKISNSEIRDNDKNGFYFSNETDLLLFKNVISTRNEKMAGSIGVQALASFDSSSDFRGNLGDDYLEVRSSDVTKDAIWNALSVPVFVNRYIHINQNKLVTINQGAKFAFASSGYLSIEGALKALGSDKEPILFTGATKSSGFWQLIQFENSVDSRNVLDHIIVEYAGSWGRGAVQTTEASKLKMTNSLLRNNAQNGFYFSNETDLLGLENVTSTNNEELAGSIGVKALPMFDKSSDFTGNIGNDYLEVRSSEVTTDQTWKALSVPVFVNRYIDIKENKLVSIEAGAKFAFTASGYLQVFGALQAIGTEEEPILFTGATKSAGFWQSIQFPNAVDERNHISHAIVEYAGGWGNANIYLNGASYITIENSTLSHSSKYGINVADCDVSLSESNNNFLNNSEGDIKYPNGCTN